MRLPAISLGRFRPFALLAAVLISAVLAAPVTASPRDVLTIVTTKPVGPALGTFSTSGAFADSGTLVTEQIHFGAIPSPFGVTTHLVLRFVGQLGTFTIRVQLIETATSDPNVFANEGNWVVVDGTGEYATLHGTGDVEGTVDDVSNLVSRDYTGLVHFK